MKWYSTKKYKPSSTWGGSYVVRSHHQDEHAQLYFASYNSELDSWENVNDPSGELNVTHFCIPDPIEIEE